jgi:hypothetical protein
MALAIPPKWLIMVTIMAFLIFTIFYGAEIFGEGAPPGSSTSPNSTGSGQETTGLFAWFSDLWDFITSMFTLMTFGIFSSSVDLHPFLSWSLFLGITMPWMFYLTSAVIEGVKALGGLIPFT